MVDEPRETEFDVEVNDSGKYLLRLVIPKLFWSRIIGSRGVKKKAIEDDTRTSLAVPRVDDKEGTEVVIAGDNRRDVVLAQAKINKIIQAARQSASYTHFISIPIINDELHANFALFKSRVLELAPSISEEVFSEAKRLHLTVTMLGLHDSQDLRTAIGIFNEFNSLIKDNLRGKPLKVEIKGVEIMNDDPSRTNVVFAKVHHPLLQELSNEIATRFKDTEYVKERDIRPTVKLHITLMNTRFLEKKAQGGESTQRGCPNRKPRVFFDATSFLQELKNFRFGAVTLQSIQLSQLGNHGSDGYYVSSATLHL